MCKASYASPIITPVLDRKTTSETQGQWRGPIFSDEESSSVYSLSDSTTMPSRFKGQGRQHYDSVNNSESSDEDIDNIGQNLEFNLQENRAFGHRLEDIEDSHSQKKMKVKGAKINQYEKNH